MASIADKFRKIKVAPTISFNRQSWITYMENQDWVWSDAKNDWSFTWEGVLYWGQDLSVQQWRDYIIKNEDKRLKQAGISITNDLTQLRQDENGLWYYVNVLGQKIYSTDQKAQTPLASIIIGNQVLNTPNYDSDDSVLDILNNPIVGKTPQVGLYDTKDYLDGIQKKKDVYRKFYAAQNAKDKLIAISERAEQIIIESNKTQVLLSKTSDLPSKEMAIISVWAGANATIGKAFTSGLKINAVSVAGKTFPLTLIASAVIGIVTKYAYSQTTGKRIKLLSEDVIYQQQEYEAIIAYIQKFSEQSSDAGNGNTTNKNIIYWAIGGAVILIAIVYFATRKS